ncbi:MAG: acyltransferase [Dysgonamonadaceae bacterium]|jgi:predicted LPLAT superfamily acyltransferase|nr:acyltransferase [Dysgonamonadaceae bacterium]
MLWKGKSRGGSFGYRFFICIIRRFGVKFAYFFLIFIVVHFIPFAPLATKSNWKYFRKIQKFGFFKTVKYLYINYFRFGQILIDKVAVRSGFADRYKYEFENYPAFLEKLDSGRGIILIGAHAGNWEAGENFFGDYANRINIVMYDAEYQKIKDILEEVLAPVNHKIIPISDSEFSHIFQIKDALDNHECVCFQGDRFIDEKSSKVMDFMGRPARFPIGPFLIASRFEAPVAFYFSMREPGMKYRFIFTVAEPRKGHSGMDELMSLYVDSLEKILKKYPEQWFNYYDFWYE